MYLLKFDGSYIDVKDYLLDYIKKYPNVKIFIGTDSQQYKKITKYASVVVLYHEGNGAHVIYEKIKEKKNDDLFSRLWNELEFSKQKALFIYDKLNIEKKSSITIDIDVNPNKKHRSNNVLKPALGYLKGFGFKVRYKPNSWAASCAADMLCK